MKRVGILVVMLIAITACNREPLVETGDLLITVEYDGYAEENVEVWLYDTWYGFQNFEYLRTQYSDANGEVLFPDLVPGWYYFEAEITKPVNFYLYAMDSIEVVEGIQKNKRLILSIP